MAVATILFELFWGGEPPELRAEMDLGIPGPSDCLLRALLLALFHERADGRAVPIGPGRLDELGASVGVAGLGDPTPADAGAA
jgi:hypothetical protein